MQRINQTFSNLQIELLRLYANDVNDVNDEQLLEIKHTLGKYFAEKATGAMDKTWEEKKLTDQDMINWTNEHNHR